MPLTIRVGLSRKASRDYQSAGASIEIEAELDRSLLADPQALHRSIHGLYEQAAAALEHRLGLQRPAGPEPEPADNGRAHPAERPATEAQRRLLGELAAAAGLDLVQLAGERCRTTPEALSMQQASWLIDHLRAPQRAG